MHIGMRNMMHVGLVGLGKWGSTILKTFDSMEGVVVHQIAAGNLVPVLDAVVIATPSRTHASVAKRYLEQGIPTFIEKPITTSLAEAQGLVALAGQAKALLFAGHIYLYNPAFWALKAALPRIGVLERIEAQGAHNRPRPHESVLWDWLPHHLCMARELCGANASSVRAEPIQQFSKDDAAHCVFTFGNVEMDSWANWAAPERRRIFHAFGSEGNILFDDSAEQKLLLRTKRGEEYIEYENTPPLTAELTAFLRCVKWGKLDRPHAEEGIAVVRMIEAAVLALETGNEIRIS